MNNKCEVCKLRSIIMGIKKGGGVTPINRWLKDLKQNMELKCHHYLMELLDRIRIYENSSVKQRTL